MKKSIKTALLIIAIVFYFISGIMLCNGYDKMTNYYNSEYSTSRNVNAYVGGDAYNYIINGNYSTGFFVLSMGFMITGTIFLSSGLIIGFMNQSNTRQIGVPNVNQEQLKEGEDIHGNATY